MELTPEQVRSSTLGACIPLRFLFRPKHRGVSRSQLPGFEDSAIFHRLWSLFGLVDPAVRPHLSTMETEALDAFMQRFEELPWEPISGHPHISQLPDNDLSPLIDLGRSLHNHLIRRQKFPFWRRIANKLRGWQTSTLIAG